MSLSPFLAAAAEGEHAEGGGGELGHASDYVCSVQNMQSVQLGLQHDPVGLELEILALNRGFGNVARRQTSALR